MEVWKTRSHRILAASPARLYRALPAVLLGVLLNTLEAGMLLS